MNLGDLRENYTKGGIRIAEMNLCPFEQFEEWITVAHESRDYFATRPYESQVGAWVSERQSKRIGVRSTLEKLDQEMRLKFPEDKTVPCPDFWGGFQLKPTYIEFWQGRQGRLHDRLRYIRHQDDWELERLSP